MLLRLSVVKVGVGSIVLMDEFGSPVRMGKRKNLI